MAIPKHPVGSAWRTTNKITGQPFFWPDTSFTGVPEHAGKNSLVTFVVLERSLDWAKVFVSGSKTAFVHETVFDTYWSERVA